MDKKPFSIVLVAPEIPGNTGSIGRTCVALDIELILIHPLGFELTEKAVRRAGLDYWKHVRIKEYQSFEDFMAKETPEAQQLLFFENDQENTIFDAPYSENCYLIFGSETKGISQDILTNYAQKVYAIPQFSPHIRSLNLSNAATTVAYQCLGSLNS